MGQTVREVIKSGYKPFIELETRTQRNQINAVHYIENLAATTHSQGKVDKWELFKVFGSSKNPKLLITNKNLINKKFFEHLDKDDAPIGRTELSNADKKKILEIADTLTNKARDAQHHVEESKEAHLERAKYHMNNFRKSLREARKASLQLKDPKKVVEQVIADIDDILADGYWKLHEVHGNSVEFITKNDVIIDWKKKKANIHLRVNFGKFKARVNLAGHGQDDITCKSFLKNLEVDGYIHPHISSQGGICWGNAEETVAEKLADNKIREVMAILGTILNSYNDEEPFVDLAVFQALSPKTAPAGTKVEKLCRECNDLISECGCEDEDGY